MVKDCYILPLSAKQEVHPALLPLEGQVCLFVIICTSLPQGLPPARGNLLLSILVRTRRARPGDTIHRYHHWNLSLRIQTLPRPLAPPLPRPSLATRPKLPVPALVQPLPR